MMAEGRRKREVILKKLTRTICALVTTSCSVMSVGCAADYQRGDHHGREQVRFVDLTHSFGAETIVWPTEQDFRLVVQQAGEMPGGYYYA